MMKEMIEGDMEGEAVVSRPRAGILDDLMEVTDKDMKYNYVIEERMERSEGKRKPRQAVLIN